MGTTIPSWSVCGDAELVVRSSDCHRARGGDQDTLSEHQKNPRVGEMGRGQDTWNTSRSVVPDGSDNAFDIQVGMERPAEMMPRAPGDVLMENKVARTYLLRADFEEWSLSEGCPGCRYLRTGQGRQQAHGEACRRWIEGLLKGDPVGSSRLAAADERINRALADAVEATRDQGSRSETDTEKKQCRLSPRVRIPEESCVGHRAGSDTTTSCLIRGIVGVRCATQRQQNRRPGE